MDEEKGTPLASFEAKWAAVYPEFVLASKFVPAQERPARAAFACLSFELEQAAFATRDAEPAAIKLQWWAEELARAGRGEARHPLTQALVPHPSFAAISSASWFAAIRGALEQREPEPAADRAALLRTYAALYEPLARIESALFHGIDATSRARAASASRALRETAGLTDGLRAGRLPLPLDLLARHRLVRGDLAPVSPARTAALQEWLAALAAELRACPASALGAIGAATRTADRSRARRAARAGEPLAALNEALGRLPITAVWAAWRAGRRSSA